MLVVWSALIRIIGTGNADDRVVKFLNSKDIYTPPALNGELPFGAANNGQIQAVALAEKSDFAHDNQR